MSRAELSGVQCGVGKCLGSTTGAGIAHIGSRYPVRTLFIQGASP